MSSCLLLCHKLHVHFGKEMYANENVIQILIYGYLNVIVHFCISSIGTLHCTDICGITVHDILL